MNFYFHARWVEHEKGFITFGTWLQPTCYSLECDKPVEKNPKNITGVIAPGLRKIPLLTSIWLGTQNLI